MVERLEIIEQSLNRAADTIRDRRYAGDQNKATPETVVERDENYLRALAEGVKLARLDRRVLGFAVLLPSGNSKVVNIHETLESEIQAAVDSMGTEGMEENNFGQA